MSDKVNNLLDAAKALSIQERAEIACRLLETLEDQDDIVDQVAIDAAWGAEADRRYQAYKRGEMKSVPVEELLEMLKPRKNP